MGLVAVISLMLSLTACVTTKTEYVTPEIVWPVFPKPSDEDAVYNDKTGKVEMSLEYYDKLKDFKIDYKATKEAYELTKKLYEGEK